MSSSPCATRTLSGGNCSGGRCSHLHDVAHKVVDTENGQLAGILQVEDAKEVAEARGMVAALAGDDEVEVALRAHGSRNGTAASKNLGIVQARV